MAESETEITKEELQKEISDILSNASLDKTSTKNVIQKLEKKLGMDLTDKKKLIDRLVMDYVNNMDSDGDGDSGDDEPVKPAPKKTKKADDDEDDEERDDSNDSDWAYDEHDRQMFLEGYPNEHFQFRPLQQEATITTSGRRYVNQPTKAVILKRVAPNYEEDEADIFGKLTAKKLRKFPDEQRDLMMIQINQLIYDKCYPPSSSQSRQEPSTAPSVGPIHVTPAQLQAKKIYRVNGLPNLLINNLSATDTIPVANVPRSADIPTQTTENNVNAGYSCVII